MSVNWEGWVVLAAVLWLGLALGIALGWKLRGWLHRLPDYSVRLGAPRRNR